MQIDIVTIFPDYFAPLDVSLIGKARAKGLLDIRVHDLRSWTDDVHKTVDDSPYGGGAGMVMKPEPWGKALDDLLNPTSVMVVPTPSGHLFGQATAKQWSTFDHLVFACGRYEGIDQRVIDHYSQTHEVLCVSLGDYVLNGGEVAVLAMVESRGVKLPEMYRLGFQNNNCIPCVKATSPDYWALVRKTHPAEFARMVKLSRDLGVRLARIKGERVFIDEIPQDWPTTNPIVPACDFLCQVMEAAE